MTWHNGTDMANPLADVEQADTDAIFSSQTKKGGTMTFFGRAGSGDDVHNFQQRSKMGGDECSLFGVESHVSSGHSYGGNKASSFSTHLTEGLNCYCGLKAVMLTSATRRNPGRKFLICPKYRLRDERCDFFLWADCENCQQLKFWVRILGVGLLLSWVVFSVTLAFM